MKAQFLAELPNDFELFETMYATRADGFRHLDRHMHRLENSALYFGFVFDEAIVRKKLLAVSAAFSDGAHRVRCALNQTGEIKIQSAPTVALLEPVQLLLADESTEANNLFLRHKSTVRDRYDAGWRLAESKGAFDMLFFNEHGELTEGGRCKVFVRLDGLWYTPPLDAGVLPGVMRSVLLDDPSWNVQQRRLVLNDLRKAEEIVVCNALRGVLIAKVLWE